MLTFHICLIQGIRFLTHSLPRATHIKPEISSFYCSHSFVCLLCLLFKNENQVIWTCVPRNRFKHNSAQPSLPCLHDPWLELNSFYWVGTWVWGSHSLALHCPAWPGMQGCLGWVRWNTSAHAILQSLLLHHSLVPQHAAQADMEQLQSMTSVCGSMTGNKT